MKRYIFLSFVLAFSLACPAMAADFWASIQESELDKPAVVALGYGNKFPTPEPMSERFFELHYLPVKIVGTQGPVEASTGLEAWIFTTTTPLAAGFYQVLVESKPAFWSRAGSGPQENKPKNEVDGATSCTVYVNYGKAVITLGTPTGTDYSAIQGQKLEIVPQKDPSTIKNGEPFPVQVLFDGKPAVRAEVSAFFAGFTEDNSSYAFSGNTNDQGVVNIIPLRAGTWLARVTKSQDYADKAVCDRESFTSTFTFTVADTSGASGAGAPAKTDGTPDDSSAVGSALPPPQAAQGGQGQN
ncbi:MAG: DUF4198 domain-containing protein [Deltaproteobacteria bacterium]|jgi:uncharacterized GH25 family protein|nr:DUF4198 domain-containing protein [Deltaproteobacteria bacterium]